MTTILLLTDFSPPARRLLPLAMHIASRDSAKIRVFHAIELFAAEPGDLAAHEAAYLRHLEEQARTRLGTTEEEIRRLGRAPVEVSMGRAGSAFSAIMDEVEAVSPDLVVMGTHGRTGLGRLLLGSVAEKVIRHAPCNVLAVPAEAALLRHEPPRALRALVASDFSSASQRALTAARALVGADGEVAVLHVMEDPMVPPRYGGHVAQVPERSPDLPREIEKQIKLWAAPDRVMPLVSEGNVAAELRRIARTWSADLVAIGRRGLSAVRRPLLGSVAERVVRGSAEAVLAVG